MSNGQRQMVLTVDKIFNWHHTNDSPNFHLAFYSLKNSSLILERPLTATPAKGEMLLNYSLKITYLNDQNQTILKLSHLSSRKEPLLLGEFLLNLDAISSRKVQFFPFGSNDRLLKIVLGSSASCPLHSRPSPNQNYDFLREKQQFLQRVINSTSSSSLKNATQPSKKSFSQRTRDLLEEVQGLKGNKKRQQAGRGIQQQFNDYQYDPITAYYTQNDRMLTSKHDRKFKKSDSEHRLGLRPQALTHQRQQSSDGCRSNRSQKHKLRLTNLQMVAVENEYYEQTLQQRKLKRRSDFYGQNNYHSKQKLRQWKDY